MDDGHDQTEEEWENDGAEVNDRSCIVSRERMDPEQLIRFVRGPDGTVVPDLKRRLPGRGAHVRRDRRAVDEAMKRRLFARAFRAEVSGPADLGALVDGLLAKAALGALGLARKAGQVATGSTKVESSVRQGKALVVLHAKEAAEDGRRKIAAARTVAAAEGFDVPAIDPFSGEEMDLALGGGNVIHAAILAGDAGSFAVKRLSALIEYRGESSGQDLASAEEALMRGPAMK